MNQIVILSGAGISAESGIKTFRDSNGLWENYRIEEVATPMAWKNNPALVQEFYNLRRKEVMNAKPNDAHFFFSLLEDRYSVKVVTQNIDDLHERAGSSHVLHLHGQIRQAKSSGPDPEKRYYPIEGSELKLTDVCDDGYPLRPHVVWFGEEVPMLERAIELCLEADVLIIVGTSLQVYPAAGLVNYTKRTCLKIVIDPSANALGLDSSFVQIQSGAVEGVKQLEKYL